MSAYGLILCGTDGSRSSLLAVDRAAAIGAGSSPTRDRAAGSAGSPATTLLLVCAYTPMPDRQRVAAEQELGAEAYKVAGSTPAEDALREARGRARAAGATTVDTLARRGEPVEVIETLLAERRPDLLVIGNRGLNSLAGRILGSVPATLTHRADCDVLIVHTTSGR